MKRLLLFAIFAISVPRLALAQANDRTLMHTFQQGSRVVYVAIVDLPSGPQGLVTSKDRSRRDQPFTVSQAQFDKMWSTLLSAGVEKYARSAGDNLPERRFDAVNYYVFSAAEMPRGFKKNYAIPNGKAPPSLVALAKQFRGYAK
jgi:hypothetical protein